MLDSDICTSHDFTLSVVSPVDKDLNLRTIGIIG